MTNFGVVLVVNCAARDDILSRREFVWPIQRSVGFPTQVVSLSKLAPRNAKNVDAIIFSGCPLADNHFTQYAKKLSWLHKTNVPLLGICAGHELLSLVFGGKLSSLKTPSIGMMRVRLVKNSFSWFGRGKKEGNVFSFYHLNESKVSLPKGFNRIGCSDQNPNEIMVHSTKKIMGFQFHPEFFHGELIHEFVRWGRGEI
ncbi:MAG: gamma-glutamyl-gamma-aminobutyrate hydrolase family protein [Candidatus Diapherotrites archaeon]